MTADFSRTNDISLAILEQLRFEPVGYGLLGCGLTVARLANPNVRLHPSTEVKFCGDMIEWVDAYFSIDVKGVAN